MEYYVTAEIIRMGGFILMATVISAAAVIFAGMLGAYAQGIATSKAVEGISKNPESRGEVMSTLIVGCAITETNGIYALLISFILLFVNPIFNAFTAWAAF
ncbi:MAG: ATP synthase Fo subunit C [Defluviitaleaceae bacterium]|nr:ATP synthase Fo subunit C [Defluviitaleaceae bacterium]